MQCKLVKNIPSFKVEMKPTALLSKDEREDMM